MTEQEYKDFVAQENSGALLIGIDRAIARKFYTDIPLSKIKDETGETPYFEKIVIWSAFLMAPCALLVSFVLAVLAFHWWSAFAIPLSVVGYFFFSGQSSMPRRGMLGISILLGLTVATLFTGFFSSLFIPWYFITVVFALWASRFVYCAATTLLRAFLLRNQRALEFMREHIQVKEAAN